MILVLLDGRIGSFNEAGTPFLFVLSLENNLFVLDGLTIVRYQQVFSPSRLPFAFCLYENRIVGRSTKMHTQPVFSMMGRAMLSLAPQQQALVEPPLPGPPQTADAPGHFSTSTDLRLNDQQ